MNTKYNRYVQLIFDMKQNSSGSLCRLLSLGVLALVLSLPLAAQAQNFGVVAGLNYSSLDNVNFENRTTAYESRSGYHIGAYFDFAIGPLGIRPGVRYIEAGPLFKGISQAIQQQTGVNVQDDFNINFVMIPLDVRLRMPLPVVKPYVFGGAELRFPMASNAAAELEDDLSPRKTAGNLGVGGEISVPTFGVTLVPEARYTFGLSGLMGETFDVGDYQFETIESQQLNMFFLTLGLQF